MANIPRVIKSIVNADLCVGCGVCAYQCPSQALEMSWNEFGFLTPKLKDNCDSNGDCLDVCPFNPTPKKEVRTENELAGIFQQENLHYVPKIGRYQGIYVGHSEEFRAQSSSGGVATFLLVRLLEEGWVDYVYSVRESQRENFEYEYAISRNKEEVLMASSTKYYPVTMDRILAQIKQLDGRAAVTGVACFVKAIRLAQVKDEQLKEKIPYVIGIICGGIKSRFFTEYLAAKTGVAVDHFQSPRYRDKDENSAANDYYFSCEDKELGERKSLRMRTVGDMWGTGLFKNNACDFCDDVTTELADVSLGDAWLEPYKSDGRGTSLIVTRNHRIDEFIRQEIEQGSLQLENLPLERFIASQQGSFNHRIEALPYRIKKATKKGVPVPPKRWSEGSISFAFAWVQRIRLKLRKKSLTVWQTSANATLFDKRMKTDLKQLKLATWLYHAYKSISQKQKSK